MRLLLLTLFAGSVLGAPKAGSKGPAPDCTAVLLKFHTDRDACLAPLGLSEWTVFPPPVTAAPPTATGAPTDATPAPVAPSTSAPITDPPTPVPTTGTPVTDAPSLAPSTVTSAPVTGAPVTAAPPTPTPAMLACAPAGVCRSFINGVDMWRGQIEWCLREAAEAETVEEVAAQIASELAIATQLVNKGCSKNEMGDLCSDGAFTALKDGGCPTETEVADWLDSYGCCVASYAELSMARAQLIEEEPCEGEFEIGKACKAPKWKLPKKAASKAAGLAKKGKIAGAVIGGVAGLGVIGFALRKRRAKLAASAKPQQATGQVAMVSVPVAV